MGTSITNIARRLGWLKGSIRIWLMYAILCVLGLCQFGCTYAQLERATINNQLALKGESLGIEVTRESEQMTPELGMQLQKGDEIKTPPGVTALIKFNDGSEVIMMPETHITIESIYVWFGKVIARVKGRFKTKTKYVTAGTRSTLFLMSVDRNDQSTVTMVEGSVLLTSNENRWPSRPLPSGQEARVLSSQAPIIETIPLERYNNILQFINRTTESIKGTKVKVLVLKVIGLQHVENEVQRVLGSAGFRIGKVSKTIEGDSPIGTVVRQQPECGKELKRGGSVDIWVRARAVVVSNVIGQHRSEAMDAIQGAGLSVDGYVQETITGRYEPGVVNDQSPRAGQRVIEGTAVKITVEAISVAVRDVRGMSVEQAESLIRELELTVRTTILGPKPDIPTPQVEGQMPEPGKLVKPGTAVTLSVVTPGARVPNLIGQSEIETRGSLIEANLRTGHVSKTTSSRYQADVVISQSPAAGQVVDRGSAVNLTVSTGPPPILMTVLPGSPRPNLTVTNVTFAWPSALTYYLRAEGQLSRAVNMGIQILYGRRSEWLQRWSLSQNQLDQLNRGIAIREVRKIGIPNWGEGQYVIRVHTDVDNQIPETNEQDNSRDTRTQRIN